jgi:hypothetical protein
LNLNTFKGLPVNIFNNPEHVAFPSIAFKVASWYWTNNSIILTGLNQESKDSMSTLADGTFHSFTMMTTVLTHKIYQLRNRAEYFENAVKELKCFRIKRGNGVSCELTSSETGFAVPICLNNFRRPFCGCEGRFQRQSCPYGFIDDQKCRSSATIECCMESCKQALDLLFILDASGSIKLPNWKKQRDFVKNIVQKLSIGIDEVRVGIITFSTTVNIEANFLNYTNKQDLIEKIEKLK